MASLRFVWMAFKLEFGEQFPLEMVICFVLYGVRVGCFDGDGFFIVFVWFSDAF